MSGVLTRLLVILAVFLAGLHVAVDAANARAHLDGQIRACAEQLSDHASHHPRASGEFDGEIVHHHHSPIAFQFDAQAQPGMIPGLPQIHFLFAPVPLTSRATPPPLDPPLA